MKIVTMVLMVLMVFAGAACMGMNPVVSADAPFVFSEGEQLHRVALPAGSVEEAQGLIDAARQENPDVVLIIEPAGDLLVGSTPLRLGSRMILRLSAKAGVAALTGSTATSLVLIEDAESVFVSSGGPEPAVFCGKGNKLTGIRVVRSKRIVLDGLILRGCGEAGIDYTGRNADAVYEAGTATRCRFEGNGDGLRVRNTAGFICQDNTFAGQDGTALKIESKSSVVAGNSFLDNLASIHCGSDRSVITRNHFDGGTALELTESSAGNLVSENTGNDADIFLAGAGQQLFRNCFERAFVNVTGDGEMILVANEGFTVDPASGVKLFNPPTLTRPHEDPAIVPGMGRFDLKLTGGNTKTCEGAVDLQAVVRELEQAHHAYSNSVVVLHLEGEFLDRSGKGMSLPPNTCLILKGCILSNPGTAIEPPWKRGVPLTQVVLLPETGYCSVSGGTIDAGRQAFFPINADSGSIALIEGANLTGGARDGINTKGRDASMPLFIYRCNVHGNRGRGIWSHAASRIHSIDNVCNGNNTDGIDIDAHALDCTALFNVCRGNRRHGVFVEEAVTSSIVFGNILSGNGWAGVHVWNEEVKGNTGGNVIAANECIGNRRGVSVGGRAADKTAHGNFFFNNVCLENWKDGIWAGNSHATNNYFSQCVLERNMELPFLSPEGAHLWNIPKVFEEPEEPEDERLRWWREARFGMFIHWGVYASLAGEWEGEKVDGYAEHIQRLCKIPRHRYLEEVVKPFNPTSFDADEWVRIAKETGMGYIVITAMHHDGVAMFDSKVDDYNVVAASRFGRDPLRELKDACDRHGIKLGVYYSHAIDWSLSGDPRYPEPWGPERRRACVEKKVLPQVRELVQRYQPALFWGDTPHHNPEELNRQILNTVRRADPAIIINGRVSKSFPGDYMTTADRPAEFRRMDGEGEQDWEAIPTTNESYGYHRHDDSHKPPAHFIRLLVNAAARGGNLLLNIGPRGDGAFAPEDVQILQSIGQWWEVNGESIRGTERAPLPPQSWGESTRKGNTVYLQVFDWPEDGKLRVGGLKSDPATIRILGAEQARVVSKRLDANTVEFAVPAQPVSTVATVLALEFKEDFQTLETRLLDPDAPTRFSAFDGIIQGETLTFGNGQKKRWGNRRGDCLVEWSNAGDSVEWSFYTIEPAVYEVTAVYHGNTNANTMAIMLDDQKLVATVEPGEDRNVVLGTFEVQPGTHAVSWEADGAVNGKLVRPCALVFTPQMQNKFPDVIKPSVYRQWVELVKASDPEKQVWLRTLEDQLGSFYFPHYLNDDLFNPSKPYSADEDCWAYVKDDPSLPRVLIVGDSISRAYTAPLRKALKGKANVHRAPANCGPTSKFLEKGEGWLRQNGSDRWDFIVVNFGIHDGKNPAGYEGRLRKVIARLKQTGAREIYWVRTTPWGKDASVFEGEAGDASKITNPISDRVAKEEGLVVIDAHAVMAPMVGTDLSRKDFTHWTPEATDALGGFIAAAVEAVLPDTCAGELLIWDDKPAGDFEAAYPVGNGRLGAMPFGSFPKERILVNEETVWANSGPMFMAENSFPHLERVRELEAAGDFQGADNYFEAHVSGAGSEGIRPNSYQLVGWLTLDYQNTAEIRHVHRSLDLKTGIACNRYILSDGSTITQEVFASAPDNVIAVTVKAGKPIDLRIGMDGAKVEGGELVKRASGTGEAGTRFVNRVRVADSAGVTEKKDALEIRGATETTLYLAVSTDFNRDEPSVKLPDGWQQKSREDLDRLGGKDVEQVRQAAVADHQEYFNRVQSDFGQTSGAVRSLPTGQRLERLRKGAQDDPDLIETYFQFGRYLLIASSRPGCLPANLQGVWNPHEKAPWNSDYHLNINIQMNYWPAETTGLPEVHLPLFDLMHSFQAPGKEMARRLGMKGWCMGHATDVWGSARLMGGKPLWAGSFFGGQWMTFHILEHYRFSLDPKILEGNWDILTASAEFVDSWLIPGPEGTLMARPACSPENTFNYTDHEGEEREAALSAGNTFDQFMILQVFSDYLEAAEALGKQNDPFVQKIRALVPKVYRPRIAEDGRLMEWRLPFKEARPGHRHISHVIGAYPGNQINLDEDRAMRDAVIKSIEGRLAQGGAGTGWSRAWTIGMFARFSDGERAYENLHAILTRSTLDNLWDSHPPFQIDGNFGATAAVAEMLLHSHNNEIKLLPALPAQWPDGHVKGLRARGGYRVDVRWQDGKLAEAVIHAGERSADEVQVVYRGRALEAKIPAGGSASVLPESF